MSRAAKSILVFLLLLLFVSVGIMTFLAFQKQAADKARISLQKQVDEYQLREKKYLMETKDLQDKLKAAEETAANLNERLASFDTDLEGLNKNIAQLKSERDQLQEKLNILQSEKKELLAKIEKQAEPKIVTKYLNKEMGPASAADTEPPSPAESVKTVAVAPAVQPEKPAVQLEKPAVTAATDSLPPAEDEAYWAKVLKDKTALALELEDIKSQLTDKMVQIEELKKFNSDLEMELGQLKNDKEAIEREIKYGNDLADNLSLALARSENEKKFMGGRVEKLNNENTGLREQIKSLMSTKIALEKSIVQLQDDKKDISRKLDETENVIQSRIDEIWRIKDSLENNFQVSRPQSNNEVELTPIVVSSSDLADPEDAGFIPPGRQGSVVSVNDENNFVIVDLGQNDGMKLGDNIAVYRGAEYVAALEVIQVRNDIAAADIKNKVTAIRVGDSVR